VYGIHREIIADLDHHKELDTKCLLVKLEWQLRHDKGERYHLLHLEQIQQEFQHPLLDLPITIKIENLRTMNLDIDKKLVKYPFGGSQKFGTVSGISTD